MTYECRVVSDVHVLTPRKNLVGGDETMALTHAVAKIATLPVPRVVLDLHRINWVSSLGVEELRRIHRSCSEQDGWMRLACVGDRIENVLLTMRLHWVFESFDSVEEALVPPSGTPAPDY
jgi:anti-anti-sigma factor